MVIRTCRTQWGDQPIFFRGRTAPHRQAMDLGISWPGFAVQKRNHLGSSNPCRSRRFPATDPREQKARNLVGLRGLNWRDGRDSNSRYYSFLWESRNAHPVETSPKTPEHGHMLPVLLPVQMSPYVPAHSCISYCYPAPSSGLRATQIRTAIHLSGRRQGRCGVRTRLPAVIQCKLQPAHRTTQFLHSRRGPSLISSATCKTDWTTP